MPRLLWALLPRPSSDSESVTSMLPSLEVLRLQTPATQSQHVEAAGSPPVCSHWSQCQPEPTAGPTGGQHSSGRKTHRRNRPFQVHRGPVFRTGLLLGRETQLLLGCGLGAHGAGRGGGLCSPGAGGVWCAPQESPEPTHCPLPPLSRLDKGLASLVRERGTDLVVIEGMGRAVHTNYYAALRCECLKLAVIKNSWLAERLGGRLFSVIFKYEVPAE